MAGGNRFLLLIAGVIISLFASGLISENEKLNPVFLMQN